MSTYPNERDCEHGRQRGKCVDCDLIASDKECDRYRRALADIAEKGGVTRNGRQCQEMAEEALKQ